MHMHAHSKDTCIITALPKNFEGENFHGFREFWSTHENFSLEIFRLCSIIDQYSTYAIHKNFIHETVDLIFHKNFNPQKI